jgi:hypothetical protein
MGVPLGALKIKGKRMSQFSLTLLIYPAAWVDCARPDLDQPWCPQAVARLNAGQEKS